MPRAAAPLLLALLCLPLALPALAGPGPGAVRLVPFTVLVDGEPATGLLALPDKGTGDVLVVVCHGLGNSAAGMAGELRAAATRGFVAVAMDYRGPRGSYNVLNGTADTLAATRWLQAAHPIERTVIWGNSMGGHVSGLAVMRGQGLYDAWVSSVGVANWAATWAQAEVLHGQGARIAADAGGTPLEKPAFYVEHSPALNPTGFLAADLDRAYLVYGSGDTTVPPSQGQELARNLAAQGVPVSLYTAVRTAPPGTSGHARYGFDVALMLAGGMDVGNKPPFVEGVHDASTGRYVPPA